MLKHHSVFIPLISSLLLFNKPKSALKRKLIDVEKDLKKKKKLKRDPKALPDSQKGLQHLQKDAKFCFSWMPHATPLIFSTGLFRYVHTESHFAGLACFELFIFLPQAPKCWGCRCAPPHLACILVCSTSSITPGADLLTRLMTVFFLLWSLSLMLVSVRLAGAGHGYACWSSAIFSHGKQCYSATVSPESMCRAFWRVTWCEVQLLSRD